VLPTVPNHSKAPTSPLKNKNARFPTEGKKAVTYYSVSGTRRPASQRAQRPSAPHYTWQLEIPYSPIKERECQVSHWGEESCNLLFCGQYQKACFPKIHRGPTLPTSPVYRKVQSPRNPSSPTERQSVTLQLTGGQPPKVHRGPAVPTLHDSDRALTLPLKSKNARFPTEGGKL
jgi:hypothetical protein